MSENDKIQREILPNPDQPQPAGQGLTDHHQVYRCYAAKSSAGNINGCMSQPRCGFIFGQNG